MLHRISYTEEMDYKEEILSLCKKAKRWRVLTLIPVVGLLGMIGLFFVEAALGVALGLVFCIVGFLLCVVVGVFFHLRFCKYNNLLLGSLFTVFGEFRQKCRDAGVSSELSDLILFDILSVSILKEQKTNSFVSFDYAPDEGDYIPTSYHFDTVGDLCELQIEGPALIGEGVSPFHSDELVEAFRG